MDRLLNYRSVGMKSIRSMWCKICLHGFRRDRFNGTGPYDAHVAVCKKNIERTTLFTMPKDNSCEFTNWKATIEKKFVVYADFESILPADTKYFQRHEPIAAGAVLIQEGKVSEYVNFVGSDCVNKFLLWIQEITRNIVYPWYESNS